MNIAQDLLKELFDYKDGQLIRKVKTSNRVNIGDVVGISNKSGYLTCNVSGKKHYIHRLVWMWHNGDIPEGLQIDHINGEKDNNNIENLRLVTSQENSFNRLKAKGYTRWERDNNWKAQIQVNQKMINLGYYKTESDARNAYIEAKNQYHTIQAH